MTSFLEIIIYLCICWPADLQSNVNFFYKNEDVLTF